MTRVLVKLLGIDPLSIPGPIALIGFILTVVLATAIVFVVWRLLAVVTTVGHEVLEVDTVRHRIVIARGMTRHDYDQIRRAIRSWKLLLIRYGSEDYLRHSAADADRQIGRPRRAVGGMSLALTQTGEVELKLGVPLHRRLGTQFRCYLEPRKGTDAAAVLTGMLRHYDEIEVLPQPPGDSRRIYFLLKRFPIVETGDQARQNYAAPA